MAYDKYKILKTYDEFYSTWTSEDIKTMKPARRKEVYNEYAVKVILMQRDSFTCQNHNCICCHNEPFYETETKGLTWHHIKFKKNGGKNTVRNGVIICDGSHNAHNKGKHPLVFANKENLPSHFRGHTFPYDMRDKKINWKKNKIKSKVIRKNAKEFHGIVLSWEMILMLIKFLGLDK